MSAILKSLSVSLLILVLLFGCTTKDNTPDNNTIIPDTNTIPVLDKNEPVIIKPALFDFNKLSPVTKRYYFVVDGQRYSFDLNVYKEVSDYLFPLNDDYYTCIKDCPSYSRYINERIDNNIEKDPLDKAFEYMDSLFPFDRDNKARAIMSIVQNLDYNSNYSNDFSELYPYQTLYLQEGICGEKTHLAMVLLNRLGYGTALIYFPDKEVIHAGLGIKCGPEFDFRDSGYCYVEMTQPRIPTMHKFLDPIGNLSNEDYIIYGKTNGLVFDANLDFTRAKRFYTSIDNNNISACNAVAEKYGMSDYCYNWIE